MKINGMKHERSCRIEKMIKTTLPILEINNFEIKK